MIRDRTPVFADVTVCKGGHDGCELRYEFVAVVPAKEIARPEHRQVDFDLLVADERVEVVGLGDLRHAQYAVMRPGIAVGRPTALHADFCATGGQERNDGHQNQACTRWDHRVAPLDSLGSPTTSTPAARS